MKMHRQSSDPSASIHPDDRIAGWIIVGLAALYTVIQLLMFAGIVTLINVTPDESAGAKGVVKGFLGVLVIIDVVVAAINVFIGVGITRSARWAFIAGLVLNILIAVANITITLAFEDLATLGTIMIAVYCYLRLSGTVGPKPV